MPIRSRMSLIMGQIEPEHPEFFAFEFGKIAESDFVYTLASPPPPRWLSGERIGRMTWWL